MMTRHLWTVCGLLAALMFAVSGCGESAPAPKPVAQADKHDDHADHKGGGHDHSGWWCGEHGVPEAECSQCSSKARAAFKAKGDWCDEHDRAKSQCFICDPKLKEKYAAIYRAKEGKEPPAMEEEAPATEAKKEGT